MPTTLLLAPPDFQTLLRPWKGMCDCNPCTPSSDGLVLYRLIILRKSLLFNILSETDTGEHSFTYSDVPNKSVTFLILFLDFFLPTWPY